MFKFLIKNKKGFTLVELVAVLLLLSLGFVALANMFKVTYRAFDKAEERYVKQEEVKLVAEMLRQGSTNVAASTYADIFDTTSIIPTKDSIDTSYSYLYFEPHKACEKCGSDWNVTDNECTNESGTCDSTKSKVDGYFLKCLNSGAKRNCDLENIPCSDEHCKCPNTKSHYCKDCRQCECLDKAFQLSTVPIYVTFKPMVETDYTIVGTYVDPNTGATSEKIEEREINSCGVIITLAALEDDFVYESKTEKDSKGNPVLNNPISDDIYYSIDVAYHFPNMVLSPVGARVNYTTKRDKSVAVVYDEAGKVKEGNAFKKVAALDDCVAGTVLRIQSDSIISRDTANAKLKTPTLCFIATASYGRDSSEVGLLCDFRDKCLLTNPIGTAFVKAYYKLSPPIADFIAESEPLKAAVRLALKPLVAVATNALDEEVARLNIVWFAMFMLCGAGATATLIKVDKRRKKAKE